MSAVALGIAGTFALAAVLVVTFGPIFYASTELDLGRIQWLAVWAWTLTCVGVLAGAFVWYVESDVDDGPNACARNGGVWSVTGSHYQPQVGKVPGRNVIEYGCVMAR